MAANAPVLQFKVPPFGSNHAREAYAVLTIEECYLARFGGLPFEPPPLNDPFLKTRPSATAGGAARAAMRPRDPTVDVAKEVIGNSWGGWTTAVWDQLRQLRAGNNVTFQAPSVDEMDYGWYGQGVIDSTTDPVTFTMAMQGASRFGRTFQVGDYILWNDPLQATDSNLILRWRYEINKIVAYNSLTGVMTVRRHPPDATQSDNAYFGTLMIQHGSLANPGQIFRLVNKVWTTSLYKDQGPQVFKFPWDNMCVPAVVGTPSGGTPVLVRTLPPTSEEVGAPGIRTCNGAQYNLGKLGTFTVNDTSDKLIAVAGPESLRCVFAEARDPVVSNTTIRVIFIDTDQLTCGLISQVTIPAGERFSFANEARQPEQLQMPYLTPFLPPIYDFPPNALDGVSGCLDAAGRLTSPGSVSSQDPTPVYFKQGGWIDFIVTAGGGEDLGVTVQS